MGVEEGTGKEIGGRRNENATMVCGVTKLDKIRNERIRAEGQRKWGKSQ